MNPMFDAFLRSWPLEPWVLASLSLTAGVYLRGWLSLHRRDPRRWPCSQPVAFAAGFCASTWPSPLRLSPSHHCYYKSTCFNMYC